MSPGGRVVWAQATLYPPLIPRVVPKKSSSSSWKGLCDLELKTTKSPPKTAEGTKKMYDKLKYQNLSKKNSKIGKTEDLKLSFLGWFAVSFLSFEVRETLLGIFDSELKKYKAYSTGIFQQKFFLARADMEYHQDTSRKEWENHPKKWQFLGRSGFGKWRLPVNFLSSIKVFANRSF